MDNILLTLEDLKLKWVTKNSGQVHYCHEENGRICAKIHESFNDLCSISFMENNEYKSYGEYINLRFAKSAVEEMLVNEANNLVNLGLR